jgi:hypothetical protein
MLLSNIGTEDVQNLLGELAEKDPQNYSSQVSIAYDILSKKGYYYQKIACIFGISKGALQSYIQRY